MPKKCKKLPATYLVSNLVKLPRTEDLGWFNDSLYVIFLASYLGFPFIVVGGTIFAWRQKFPTWSYPWLGVCLSVGLRKTIIFLSMPIILASGLTLNEFSKTATYPYLFILLSLFPLVVGSVILLLKRGWLAAAYMVWLGTPSYLIVTLVDEVVSSQGYLINMGIMIAWEMSIILLFLAKPFLKVYGFTLLVICVYGAYCLGYHVYRPGDELALPVLIMMAITVTFVLAAAITHRLEGLGW